VDADFHDVEVHVEELHLRFGTTEYFISSSSFAELDEKTAASAVQDVQEAMRYYASEQGIIVPTGFLVGLARK
jgi:hypothetical protein